MKKSKRYISLTIVLFLILSLTNNIYASTSNSSILVEFPSIKLNIDNNYVILKDATGNTVEPFVYNGTTYLPVRAVAAALNIDVSWDGLTSTVFLKSKNTIPTSAPTTVPEDKAGYTKTIDISYSDIKININGYVIEPKDVNGNLVEPFISNGTTYLPIRALANALFKGVMFYDKTNTIYIADEDKFPTFKDMKVHYLNVGQGDSEFIELPDGVTMLIDAGSEGDGENIGNYIKGLGYNKIDIIIATHPHADHIGGMVGVIKNIDSRINYVPKAQSNTTTYMNFITTIGIVHYAKAGVSLIDTPNLKVYFIAPNSDSYDELNNYSAVLKIVYKNNTYLFTGDAQTESENEMLAKGYDIRANVLKVGHHGSTTSSSKAFLKAVSPKYAVIPVGKDNSYGHPSQKILNNLGEVGASVYRTDIDGTVVMTSDGSNISVSTNSFATAGWLSVKNEEKPLPDGTVTTSKDLVISSVDKKAEFVTIKNNGTKDVNLANWVLISVTGYQRFKFPIYTLKAGATVTVASGGASGDFIWTDEDIWNNLKSDPAQLYDAQGNLISTYDS